MEKDKKENIFIAVQRFLKNPPLIIWGSGATISFGLPSMYDLNKELKSKICGFNAKNNNLEIELGKKKYQKDMTQIKKVIWDLVIAADTSALKRIIFNNTDEFNGIKLLIEKFIGAQPEVVNIVTTNYDRILEHTMSYHNFPYTDGFNGKVLSLFDKKNFKDEKVVNLVKVHGSLNWFDIADKICFLSSILSNEIPKIIAPGGNKYEEALSSPYRELIQKSDNLIEAASSFLVVGFGFNDKHLTPKIKTKVEKGTPIVIITKKISKNSYSELKNAKDYVFFEKSGSGKTKIIYKENKVIEKQETELDGDFWQLNNFMEIV